VGYGSFQILLNVRLSTCTEPNATNVVLSSAVVIQWFSRLNDDSTCRKVVLVVYQFIQLD